MNYQNAIFLAQTDTTVGFISQNPFLLARIKKRADSKPILQTLDSLKTLKNHTRIPAIHKKLIRNAKKTSFIFPNKMCFRVVRDSAHATFLSHLRLLGYPSAYSTSANKTRETFNLTFAMQNASIIVFDQRGLRENPPSKIMKLTLKKKSVLR